MKIRREQATRKTDFKKSRDSAEHTSRYPRTVSKLKWLLWTRATLHKKKRSRNPTQRAGLRGVIRRSYLERKGLSDGIPRSTPSGRLPGPSRISSTSKLDATLVGPIHYDKLGSDQPSKQYCLSLDCSRFSQSLFLAPVSRRDSSAWGRLGN